MVLHKDGKVRRLDPKDHMDGSGSSAMQNSETPAMGDNDGDENRMSSKSMIVGKSHGGQGTNTPRTSNTETEPKTTPGKPTLRDGESGGSGSTSTSGDPTFNPISSSNVKADQVPPYMKKAGAGS